MRQTKKLTLCAILTALGAVIMMLGAVVEVLDLTVCALASLIMVFVYLEIGAPYTYLVWICTSLVTGLIYPGSIVWIEYFLVFGIYPIVKAYVERLTRWLWIPVKLVYVNAVCLALFFVSEKLFGVPFFEDDLLWLKVVTWGVMNIAFLAYDLFITTMVKFYYDRIRRRFFKFLK